VTRSVARIQPGCTPANQDRALRCLDLGTGSGAIAIAIAHLLPSARVVAVDITQAALDVAQLNLLRLGLEARVELMTSDLFSAFADSDARFDLIVANPPYVPTSLWQGLDRSVRDHEPRTALDGGPDGLDFIVPILKLVRCHLNPGGLLAMEIDPAVSERIRDVAPSGQIEQDWQGSDRYLFLS
jgi:HemK-like putative methylase